MKKQGILIVFVSILTTLFCACPLPWAPDLLPKEYLVLTAKDTPYGIQLSATTEVENRTSRGKKVTYDSEDKRVLVISEATDVGSLDLSTATVAILNTDTGIITPVGSDSTNITVTATNGEQYGTLEVSTSIINLARTWVLRMDEAAQSVYATTLTKDPSFTLTLTFYASVDTAIHPERIHYNSRVYSNRLNAGYYTISTSPNIKYTWEAIDGHLILPTIQLNRTSTSYMSIEGTDGDSGAYDTSSLQAILSMNMGSIISIQTVPLEFSIDSIENTLHASVGSYILTLDVAQ